MEAAFNTIVEKIISRTITFLIDKFPMPTAQAMEDQSMHSLKQLLLRAHVIVKEAEGRHITNQAMVQQLNILRKEVYRGHYTLDNFRSQYISEEKKAHDHGVSHSFCQSKFNPSKRVFLSSNNNTHGKEEMRKVIESLNNIINDMNEFVAFLKNYSPIYRQPYTMHLFLDKCMFGRQIEMDRVMRFLVETNSFAQSVGVLPIFGPPASGKSTLVSHVCNNERVRDLFSQIIFITEDDLKEQVLHNTKDSCAVIKYQGDASDGNKALLLIIELPKDIDDDSWKNIYSIYVGRIASGSKVIITSRSRKVIDFGTTRALELNYLSKEEFWYFFKVLTFGSTDPEEQPKLASMAMEIGMVINGSFIGANIIGGVLRSNLNARFWSRALKYTRLNVQKNTSMFGEHPGALLQKNKPTFFGRMASADFCVVHNQYQTNSGHGEIPNITFADILFGTEECRGRIEILAWRSQIPPYKNHIFSCEIRKPSCRATIKKSSRKKKT